MKKYIIIVVALLLLPLLGTAQVLYNETFDNLTVGNLGTDPTGVTPGQGGWLTEDVYAQYNSVFTIVNETNRGKVLDLTTPYSMSNKYYLLINPHLNTLIDNRTAGNDVIKIEIDYFTGNKIQAAQAKSNIRLLLKDMSLYLPPDEFIIIQLEKDYGVFNAFTDRNNPYNSQIFAQYSSFPFNTWVTLIMYLDYPNNKIYMHIPQFNKVSSSGLVTNPTSTNLMQDYKLQRLVFETAVGSSSINRYSSQRYDNIKITALNEVPPAVINLSTNEQLAAKFNLYPNPATNVVNITNSENMLVNKVTVYDISGKQLSTQSFNNETQVQLNVENLANDTYMLHLQTNEGTAVKKLVKK